MQAFLYLVRLRVLVIVRLFVTPIFISYSRVMKYPR
jgi:hypothetical protein